MLEGKQIGCYALLWKKWLPLMSGKVCRSSTGCESTAKAYKFFAEPGYLHDIK
ncbi:unnamed protein product, partial [Porites lobata]